MNFLDEMVEQRLAEAAARGEFDDLPGAGKPLPPEPDDALVPPELRMAYKILKNAGYVPEEVRLRREIHDVEALIQTAHSVEERSDAARRLRLLISRLGQSRGGSLQIEQAYYDQVVQRLSGDTKPDHSDK